MKYLVKYSFHTITTTVNFFDCYIEIETAQGFSHAYKVAEEEKYFMLGNLPDYYLGTYGEVHFEFLSDESEPNYEEYHAQYPLNKIRLISRFGAVYSSDDCELTEKVEDITDYAFSYVDNDVDTTSAKV